MEIIAQTNSIGAEIRGVDISKKLSNALFEKINDAFLQYQIVFFRNQKISPAQYCRFANMFGPLQDYMFAEGVDGFPAITEIVKTETETESFGSFWHSDSTYLPLPPKLTMLYAREVPERGGDTLFADMYAAYNNLSSGLREMLDPLFAINSAEVVSRDENIYQEVKSKNSDKLHQQAIHPVIRVHGETNKKALYVNSIHTLAFDGMSREESLPILEYLYSEIQKPEYAFRLQWQIDTLAIWDNRCTQHYALNDYHGHRRVMHRVIVEGEKPR